MYMIKVSKDWNVEYMWNLILFSSSLFQVRDRSIDLLVFILFCFRVVVDIFYSPEQMKNA